MYCAVPPIPCSGANKRLSLTPECAESRSTKWPSSRSTLVWLTIAPTLIPRSAEKPSDTQTSSPVRTMCSSGSIATLSRMQSPPAAPVFLGRRRNTMEAIETFNHEQLDLEACVAVILAYVGSAAVLLTQ